MGSEMCIRDSSDYEYMLNYTLSMKSHVITTLLCHIMIKKAIVCELISCYWLKRTITRSPPILPGQVIITLLQNLVSSLTGIKLPAHIKKRAISQSFRSCKLFFIFVRVS